MTKIYTKTGDKGKTSLFNGKRVLKSDARVDSYGTVDELNSHIGVAIAELSVKRKAKSVKLRKELEAIQHELFEIGAGLAHPGSPPVMGVEEAISGFETSIDKMTNAMPVLTGFILPGGTKAAAQLHIARTICRRAERRIVQLMQTEEIDESIVKYINRLSDLLFTMARYANFLAREKDVKWKKK